MRGGSLGALPLVLFALGGCVGGDEKDAWPKTVEVDIIEAEYEIWWSGDEPSPDSWPRGDHCVFTRWEGDHVWMDRNDTLPDAFVVFRYERDDFGPSGEGLAEDFVMVYDRPLEEGTPYPLLASFDTHLIANLTWMGDHLLVDGETIASGGEATITDSYEVQSGNVTESVTFRVRPAFPVVLDPQPTFCE